MADKNQNEDSGRSIPGRVAAFDAVVEIAIDTAADDGSSRSWRSDIETADVAKRVEQDVSDRTVLRALKDAAALGWVEDRRQGWNAGPRAEGYQPVDDDENTPPI